jgi:hypothetical protein
LKDCKKVRGRGCISQISNTHLVTVSPCAVKIAAATRSHDGRKDKDRKIREGRGKRKEKKRESWSGRMDSRDVSNPHNIGIYERGSLNLEGLRRGKTARMIPYIRSTGY